jgi:hypothetical protein
MNKILYERGDFVLGGFTSGFKELVDKLNDAKTLVPSAIDYALEETGETCAEDTAKASPVKTTILQTSWEVNPDSKQTGGNTSDDTHSLEVWSNPEIIAIHPEHPDGEYYPPLIENGFMKKDGKYYTGVHMLKNSVTKAKDNLKDNLTKEIKDVFR